MLTKEFNPDKLRDKLQMEAIKTRRPLSCTFELTYRCNFSCPMCYIRMTDEQAANYGKLRSVDEWLDMARQAHAAGVLYLNLTGGECTLYPGFERLYTELYGMGFRLSIMTNAGAFTDRTRNLFKEFPPYGVSVTLYGGCNETYGKVTGDFKGYDKVVENIRFLKSLGVPVLLNFTMIKQNVLDYLKVGETCKDLGLPYTLIDDITGHRYDAALSDAKASRLTPAERACVICHTPGDVEQALDEACELEKELAYFVAPGGSGTQMPKAGKTLNACIGSYSSAAILWNGAMQTCISLAECNPVYPFEVGFEAAWQELQKKHDERFKKPSVCESCEMQEDCVRSCPARHFEGTGNTLVPDSDVCKYVWLVKKKRANVSARDNSDLSPVNLVQTQDC